MSSPKVKFGWKAGTEQYPPQELLDYAVVAEEAGFDSIDASDHFHPWSERGQACFVWTWLGATAVKTTNIMLGTGVTCPILRYHPAIIAQAAATLACLVPGRAFLGIGTVRRRSTNMRPQGCGQLTRPDRRKLSRPSI